MRHKLGLLVFAIATVGVLLMASCSTSQSGRTSSDEPATTKPYGSLAVAMNFLVGGLDPQVNTPNTLQSIALGIFDSLIELTPEGQVRPGIAERWEISPDGKSHEFYIRKGVKFHDGSELTGADVKFSLDRMLAPEATHQDATSWRPLVAGVDLKDSYTVVIRLKEPLFELLTGLAEFTGISAVVPKKYIEEKGADYFGKYPVGSGPWKVLKWEPGIRLDLEAVEDHWRAAPKFKELSIINVTEEGTKVAMLKTGQLDMAPVSPDSVAGLKSAGLRIYAHDGRGQYMTMVFYDMDNPQNHPLGDVKVRRAVSLSVDRKELAEKVYGGYAEPSAMAAVVPSAYFWDSNVLKVDPFDPEGAKKILAEVGYPNGFATKIWDMGGGGILSTFNQALAGYLRKVGINAGIEAIEQAALTRISRPLPTAPTFNTLRPQTTGGGIFQFEKMTQTYHSKKGSTRTTRNLKLDELIDKVPLTRDAAEKKRLALEAATLARNEYGQISFLNMKTLFALGPKVGDIAAIQGLTGMAASLVTVTHAK